MINFRQNLKKNKFIFKINALIKSFLLKKKLNKLRNHYSSIIIQNNIFFDEESTLDDFYETFLINYPHFIRKPKGLIKIFWVGASQPQDESGFLQALRNIGIVNVFFNKNGNYGPLYFQDGLSWQEVRRLNDKTLLSTIVNLINDEAVDLLIGQMWSHLFSSEVLRKIKALGIPVINIAMDDRLPELWGFKDNIRQGAVGLGDGVDITLTTVSEVCAWYACENMKAIFWPLSSSNNLFFEGNYSSKDIDILFIGNCYGIRKEIVEYLEKNGFRVTCFGSGWKNGPVDADKNIILSKKAKIILGIGTVAYTNDVYTLKLRDFDALMTGALYITHRNPDLLKLFEEGKHLECYSSKEELVKKLSYFVNHPEEIYKIGMSGNEYAKKYFDWDVHLTNTFKKLKLIN